MQHFESLEATDVGPLCTKTSKFQIFIFNFDPALVVNSLKCVQPADVPFTRRSSNSSLAVRATSAIMPLGDVEGYDRIQKTRIPLGIPKALVSIGGIAYFNEPPLKAMFIYLLYHA